MPEQRGKRTTHHGFTDSDPGSLGAAGSFLQAVIEDDFRFVPLADGGVQIECEREGFEMEVEFEPRTTLATGVIIGYWKARDP